MHWKEHVYMNTLRRNIPVNILNKTIIEINCMFLCMVFMIKNPNTLFKTISYLAISEQNMHAACIKLIAYIKSC